MDWLKETNEYDRADINHFRFAPCDWFHVRTVTVISKDGEVQFESRGFHTEAEFRPWIEKCHLSIEEAQPAFFLVVHLTKEDDDAATLPYSKELFEILVQTMFQHRSLAWSMSRQNSTAFFSSKRVNWMIDHSEEQSIVYNCKSDTGTRGNVRLSTTYFQSRPWTFSVMYGCEPEMVGRLLQGLGHFREKAFHPLVMPMIFAELEHSRFLTAMEGTEIKLAQRILNLEHDYPNSAGEGRTREESQSYRQAIRMTALETPKLWHDVRLLKNGFDSFKVVLAAIDKQCATFGEAKLQPVAKGENQTSVSSSISDHIRSRLEEMMAEVDFHISSCDSSFTALERANQLENDLQTKRNEQLNLFMAQAMRQDSTQMKRIAWVGMIFLPSTFLATFFSTSFFRWIPDESTQVVSPWIWIYLGLAVVITGAMVIFWIWRSRADRDPDLESMWSHIVEDDR